MDFLLHRYKNVTVLLVVVAAQLVLLAYQVKSNQDMRLIRVWSITAITPIARVIEFARGGTTGFFRNYIVLYDARQENQRMKTELDRLKLENQFLRTELSTAERARVLAAFQSRTPSKTVAARIIANTTGANSKVVYVDRGSTAGVLPGMAVITPDGIIGKVVAVYPTASQVMLVYDSAFAAGVVSEKHRVQGTLKGQGHGTMIIDHVPSEMKVEPGEKFFTSGDDRIFPKGLPAAEVKVVRPGRVFKEILVAPTGFAQGLEEVLIVIEGVHQVLPTGAPETTPYHVLPPPEPATPGATSEPVSEGAAEPSASADQGTGDEKRATESDRIRARYRRLSEAQGFKVGHGGRIPNFNAAETPAPKPQPPAAAPTTGSPSPAPPAAPSPNAQ